MNEIIARCNRKLLMGAAMTEEEIVICSLYAENLKLRSEIELAKQDDIEIDLVIL